MLGLLLLRHYSARAWTWPPLLWWEAGLLLLLHGFSLSTAGPLFEPWAGEILQKGAHRHISSDLYLFPGAGPFFAPWAADILQKGGHRHISSDLCLFPGAGLLFEPWAAEMLQKGGHRHISSDLSIFPGAGPLFEPWEAGILHKGELQPDVKLGGFNFVSSFAQGKCIASLQEDPAADSLYLGCFCCATTMQRLELDLRFCDRKLDCFFCWSASPYLPLDPFLRRVRLRSSKKEATATSAQTLTFFQALDPFLSRERPRSSKKGATATSAPIFQFSRRWTPFWAVRGRDPPQRGASTWRLTRWLQLCFFFCAGKVHCFSARGSRCRQFMLGLLLLRYYNAKAWTWPPLLWSETGLLLLLIGFSLSTAGPLFAPCAAEILQKGGYRHISSDLDLFPGAGPLFAPWAAEILQKGGHRHISSDLYLFPGAGPLFEPWAAEILRKGGHRHISSDLYNFPGAGPLFEPWEAGILHKGELQPDVKLGGLNFVSSFAQGKCIASLQEDPAADSLCLGCFCCATTMQGLELDLRFCDRKLDCFFCWSASPYLPLDPFSSPRAAEILQKGAPQPDVKRAAIWFFPVPLPHIEAVPLSALSVPVLCACLLARVAFFWQIPFPKHCSE